MAKQVKSFVIARAGTKPYWCLQNVRLGYGLGPKHAYALLDWQNNVKQHKNQKFPAGVAVPVYWNWTGTVEGVRRNWGHIGVRLPDGKIWTDGKYFSSVSDVSKNYLGGGSYLGWGESVEGVRVIKEESMATRKEVKLIFQKLLFRNPEERAYKNYTPHNRWFVFTDIAKSGERKRKEEKIENLEATLDVLKQDLQKANKAVTSLSARPTRDEYQRALDEAEKRLQDAISACEVHEEHDEQEVVESWLKSTFKRLWNALFGKD